MALSYIGGGGAQANTVTIPAGHAVGDLLLIFAFRDGNTTSPSLPAGWTSVGLNAGTLCASIVGYKVATSATETSGTWTNADAIVCHVYRGQLTTGAPVVNWGGQAGSSTTTINYSGIVTMTDPGFSWVALFAGTSSTDSSLETPKSSTTNRTSNVGATCEVAGHDTNGTVSSFSFGSVSIGGTAGTYITKTLEILAARPKAATLVDSFTASSADTNLWAVDSSSGSIAQTGGQVISSPASNSPGYNGYLSVNTYDLTSSSITIEIVQGCTAADGVEQGIDLYIDANNKISFFIGNGTALRLVTGGVDDSTYIGRNDVTMRWWRIRESGGTIYWETSPDGSVWTTQTTKAVTFSITTLHVSIFTGTWQNVASPGTGIFDNINTLGSSPISWLVA